VIDIYQRYLKMEVAHYSEIRYLPKLFFGKLMHLSLGQNFQIFCSKEEGISSFSDILHLQKFRKTSLPLSSG
jgi:hypothetical protein